MATTFVPDTSFESSFVPDTEPSSNMMNGLDYIKKMLNPAKEKTSFVPDVVKKYAAAHPLPLEVANEPTAPSPLIFPTMPLLAAAQIAMGEEKAPVKYPIKAPKALESVSDLLLPKTVGDVPNFLSYFASPAKSMAYGAGRAITGQGNIGEEIATRAILPPVIEQAGAVIGKPIRKLLGLAPRATATEIEKVMQSITEKIKGNKPLTAAEQKTYEVYKTKWGLDNQGYKPKDDSAALNTWLERNAPPEKIKPVEERLIEKPIHEERFFPEIAKRVQDEAGALESELSGGEAPQLVKRFDDASGTTFEQYYRTRSTNPEWFQQLGKTKADIFNAIEKIKQDKGRDKGKLVEDVKAVILKRLTQGVNEKNVMPQPPDEAFVGQLVKAKSYDEYLKAFEPFEKKSVAPRGSLLDLINQPLGLVAKGAEPLSKGEKEKLAELPGKATASLLAEARKYKTPEEFVKSGKSLELNDVVPDDVMNRFNQLHATFSGAEIPEKYYGKLTLGQLVDHMENLGMGPNDLSEVKSSLLKLGYRKLGDKYLVEGLPGFANKSQLTDIWNQAQGEAPGMRPGIFNKPLRFVAEGAEPLSQKEKENLAKLPSKIIAPSILKKPVFGNKPLSTQTIKVIASQAQKIGEETGSAIEATKTDRLFQVIATKLEQGELMTANLGEALRASGMTPAQFAHYFKQTTTTSARNLNVLSQLKRKILEDAGDLPDDLIGLLEIKLSNWEIIKRGIRTVEGKRRGLLVPQLATAMRNLFSQGQRYSINVLDDALQGVLNVKQEGAQKAFTPLFEDFAAVVRRFKPQGRQNLERILDQDPIGKVQLLSTPVQDVVLSDKVIRILNTANTMQEKMFRKLAFDAKVNAEMRIRGLDVKGEVPQDIIEAGVQHALDLTYANAPEKGTFGKAVVNAYKELPFLTALGTPFPRFWANSMKFLYEFNPTGFLSLLSPSTRQQIAANPKIASKIISRAMIGTTMLGAAVALRSSKYAGEKWYEIKVGNETYDCRAYAPISQYLFLADLLNPEKREKLDPVDYAQATISVSRIAGTGLVLADLLRAKDPATGLEFAKRFAGAYIGGFTVPFRMLKDFIAGADESQKYSADTKEQGLSGPAISNIPYGNLLYNKTPKVVGEGYLKTERPVMRQLTGLTPKAKVPAEAELDRLGIPYFELGPKSGNAQIDNKMTEYIQEPLTKAITGLLSDPNYQAMDDENKIATIKEIAKQVRAEVGSYFEELKQLAKVQKQENKKSLGNYLMTRELPTKMRKDQLTIILNGIPSPIGAR